jgi:transposase
MRSFIEPERNQLLLLTNVNLETIAPIGSAVRTIDELVDRLDTSAIEATYDLEAEQGQKPIHPKTLIKVALFAIHNCRFSLRKMEYDTGLNLAYRWLTGDRTIDHSTMGKFLCRYRHAIVELASQTVLICVEEGLVDFEVLAIDSIKVRANASHKQHKTLAAIEKERKKIEEMLGGLLDEAAASNEIEAEKATLENRKKRLEAAAERLEQRIQEKGKEKSKKQREELERKEKINITDPDARIMQQRNGEKNPSYSVTTTTDTQADIITDIQVNEENNDAKALLPAIEGSKEASGEAHRVVLADPAFSSIENLEKLEDQNIDALVPDRRMEVEERNELAKGEYDRAKFKWHPETHTYVCPTGERLEKSGEATINGRRYDKYTNTAACAGCAYKTECTKMGARIIYRDQNEEVKERMREKFEGEENKELYKKRAHAAEAPYGHIKHNLKFKILMRRGITKVRMEMALLGILHNGLKLAGWSP